MQMQDGMMLKKIRIQIVRTATMRIASDWLKAAAVAQRVAEAETLVLTATAVRLELRR